MTVDLGYNKPTNQQATVFTKPVWNVLLKEKPIVRERTMEEHRAILGAYWLNSMYASGPFHAVFHSGLYGRKKVLLVRTLADFLTWQYGDSAPQNRDLPLDRQPRRKSADSAPRP
jgi:hypothetical protein